MKQDPLDRLSGHAIICGSGRVGSHVLEELEDGGIACVVIDPDPEKAEERRAAGRPVLEGDATDQDVLVSAGVERARYLVAAAPSDAVNLFVTFSARHLNPDLVIVSQADAESSESKLITVGANHVVQIYHMAALTMIGLLLASSEDTEAPTETSAHLDAPMPGEKSSLDELDEA